MLETLQQTHALFPHFFTGAFFVLGAVVGSFLNVCILRVPRGESVVFPGSHCACGAPIPLRHNIPILSWFILRGRAACCGRRFGFRYAAVEALTGTLFACAWQFFPWQDAVALMLFCAFAVVLAFIDWDTMCLPDSVNAPFVVAGLLCSFALPEIHGAAPAADAARWLVGFREGFVPAVVGLTVGSALAYWVRYFASVIARREAMGEGDVILLGGVGAFFGWRGAVFAFFASSFLGIAAALLARIFGKRVPAAARPAEASRLALEGDEDAAREFAAGTESSAFPLGPWLLLGALIYRVCGEALLARLFPFT